MPHVPGPKPSGQTRARTFRIRSEELLRRVTSRQPRRPGGEPRPLMPKHSRPIPHTISLAGHLQGPSSATRGRRQKGVEGHIREILRLFRSRPHRGAVFSGNTYIISSLREPEDPLGRKCPFGCSVNRIRSGQHGPKDSICSRQNNIISAHYIRVLYAPPQATVTFLYKFILLSYVIITVKCIGFSLTSVTKLPNVL